MGQVNSTPAVAAPYTVDAKRFCVQKFECCLNEGDQTSTAPHLAPASSTVSLSAEYSKPAQRLTAQRGDRRPLTFVQDPESSEIISQSPYQPSSTSRFCLSVASIPGNEQHRLVFAHAASHAESQHVVATRAAGSCVEVGTWTEPRHPVIEKSDFSFVWDAAEDRPGGQPVHFAFFFDGQAANHQSAPRLAAGAAVWVSERPSTELASSYEPQTPIVPTNPVMVPRGSPAGLITPVASSPPQIRSEQMGSQNIQSSQGAALSNQSAQSGSLQGAQSSQGGAQLSTSSGSISLRRRSEKEKSEPSMPYGMPSPTKASPLAQRPGPEHVFSPEDGPRFRSALVNMERRVPTSRARIKQSSKRTLMSRERLEASIEADQWLASSMQEAARYECPSFKPIADWFSRSSEGGLSSIQRQRKVTLNELTTRSIEPSQRFYEYDIKAFEQRKREFEEESNQFYSWTSRYLANRKDGWRGKVAEAADVKFSMKKRAFDVARFDYFNYMNELTIGSKQQILVQLMALAAQSLTDSHIALGSEMSSRTQPRVDAVVEDIKRAAREWEAYRLENIQYRKKSTEHFANDAERVAKCNRQGSPELTNSGGGGASSANSAPGHSPTGPKNYKEGSLWASSRPEGHQESQVTNKQALQNSKWHKYWVVLDGSSSREYTNWKQSVVEMHNEPINLLVAGVREARSNDRRFCFEVVTPQYKRVYQATSEDDVRAWIAAINKSISTSLEASDDQQLSPIREHEPDSIGSPTTSGAANSLHALTAATASPNSNTDNNGSGSGSGSGSGNGTGSGTGAGTGNGSGTRTGTGSGPSPSTGGSGSGCGTGSGTGSGTGAISNNTANTTGSSAAPGPSDHAGNGNPTHVSNVHANPSNNANAAVVNVAVPKSIHPTPTIDMAINSGLSKKTAGYTTSGAAGRNGSNESLDKKNHSHHHNEDRLDKSASTFSIKGSSSGQRSDRPRVPPINTASSHSNKPISPSVPLSSPHLNYEPPQDDLIRAVYREPSNRICAECKSTQNVEWVSINLLVVICIECSGAHRSSGSHISKVRSLTSDTGAFTPSLKAASFSVSNEVINSIWEAKLPPNHNFPSDSSGQARKKFVTEKYVEKQFIKESEKPNSVLRRAIKEQDIPLICAASASRANPNGVSDADEPMSIHASRSAAPSDKTFPAAEVLIKNGASVPPLGVYTGLSQNAENYLASKQSAV